MSSHGCVAATSFDLWTEWQASNKRWPSITLGRTETSRGLVEERTLRWIRPRVRPIYRHGPRRYECEASDMNSTLRTPRMTHLLPFLDVWRRLLLARLEILERYPTTPQDWHYYIGRTCVMPSTQLQASSGSIVSPKARPKPHSCWVSISRVHRIQAMSR
jgi:hypothetical protein